jgi:hypothetical protein
LSKLNEHTRAVTVRNRFIELTMNRNAGSAHRTPDARARVVSKVLLLRRPRWADSSAR